MSSVNPLLKALFLKNYAPLKIMFTDCTSKRDGRRPELWLGYITGALSLESNGRIGMPFLSFGQPLRPSGFLSKGSSWSLTDYRESGSSSGPSSHMWRTLKAGSRKEEHRISGGIAGYYIKEEGVKNGTHLSLLVSCNFNFVVINIKCSVPITVPKIFGVRF